MKKIYFITGSQDLYGEETLTQAEKDSKEMADFLSSKLNDIAVVEHTPIVKTAGRSPSKKFLVCIAENASS